MFDVASAFQTTRRKTMARSRKPTPLHSRSRRVWQMSLTSAFVHGMHEVSNLFLSLCEVGDLKDAQYSEEVRQVVQLVFVGGTCEVWRSSAITSLRQSRERAQVQYPATHSRLISTSNRRRALFVLPSRCKSGWHSQPKS